MTKVMSVSMLAALLLAMPQGVALAQGDPATRACMQGEQEIGGICQPLTRSPGRSRSNAPDTGNSDSTGSVGGGSQGGRDSGGQDGSGSGNGGSGGGRGG